MNIDPRYMVVNGNRSASSIPTKWEYGPLKMAKLPTQSNQVSVRYRLPHEITKELCFRTTYSWMWGNQKWNIEQTFVDGLWSEEFLHKSPKGRIDLIEWSMHRKAGLHREWDSIQVIELQCAHEILFLLNMIQLSYLEPLLVVHTQDLLGHLCLQTWFQTIPS